MYQKQKSSTRRYAAPLHPWSGVLSVIQPRVDDRGNLEGHAQQMVTAQMAMAMRDDPPHALQLALMLAYQRGRKVR